MSLAELRRHVEVWERKPSLRRVYAVWFDQLAGPLPQDARVLEIGAGPGFFARHARATRKDLRWVSADITAAPWNDLAADALRLPFRDAAFDAVVGLDVVHHLAEPLRFCAEAARVLRPGGRLAVIEPWVTPMSYPIYRWLHPERCEEPADAAHPFAHAGAGDAKDAFDGNAAILPALVRRTSGETWRAAGLEPPAVRLLNSFAYLLTLGFRGPSLLPAPLAPAMIRLDAVLASLSSLTAMRARAVWVKDGSPRSAR